MPENKTIHDLPIAEQTSASDLFETEIPSQLMQSGYASRKVSASELADLFLNDMTFPQDLQTTAKKIIPAINEAAQSGGGGGSSTLAGLSDVDIDDQTLADGQALIYDGTNDEWVNGDVSSGASANEAEPYDSTESYSYGDYCIYNNYLWRCTSTSTVTGTWDATKWVAVLVTDEYKRVRVMTKTQFDALSSVEKDGLIYVSDYPTKIQDIDNVTLTTSDNNKLLSVSVSGSDISVGAVSSLFKVVSFNLTSCTVPANGNKLLLGNAFVDTTDTIPSGYSPRAIVGTYGTNNNIIFNKVEATQAGGTGTFVTLKNVSASDATGYVQVKILYIKNELL